MAANAAAPPRKPMVSGTIPARSYAGSMSSNEIAASSVPDPNAMIAATTV